MTRADAERVADERIVRAIRLLIPLNQRPYLEADDTRDYEDLIAALAPPAAAPEPQWAPNVVPCEDCNQEIGNTTAHRDAHADKCPGEPAPPCTHEHQDLVLKCHDCGREDKPPAQTPPAPEQAACAGFACNDQHARRHSDMLCRADDHVCDCGRRRLDDAHAPKVAAPAPPATAASVAGKHYFILKPTTTGLESRCAHCDEPWTKNASSRQSCAQPASDPAAWCDAEARDAANAQASAVAAPPPTHPYPGEPAPPAPEQAACAGFFAQWCAERRFDPCLPDTHPDDEPCRCGRRKDEHDAHAPKVAAPPEEDHEAMCDRVAQEIADMPAPVRADTQASAGVEGPSPMGDFDAFWTQREGTDVVVVSLAVARDERAARLVAEAALRELQRDTRQAREGWERELGEMRGAANHELACVRNELALVKGERDTAWKDRDEARGFYVTAAEAAHVLHDQLAEARAEAQRRYAPEQVEIAHVPWCDVPSDDNRNGAQWAIALEWGQPTPCPWERA